MTPEEARRYIGHKYGIQDPPPPYVPIDVSIVERAYRDAMRVGRNWAIAATLPIAALNAALYFAGAPGVVLVLLPVVIAGATTALHWFMRRRRKD